MMKTRSDIDARAQVAVAKVNAVIALYTERRNKSEKAAVKETKPLAAAPAASVEKPKASKPEAKAAPHPAPAVAKKGYKAVRGGRFRKE